MQEIKITCDIISRICNYIKQNRKAVVQPGSGPGFQIKFNPEDSYKILIRESFLELNICIKQLEMNVQTLDE